MKLTRSAWLLSLLSPVLLAQTRQLTADELAKLLDEGKVFLLDVREPQELKDHGAVKGYVNIPLGQLESRLSEIPKDKVIATFCARGVRAGKAGDLLEKHGYKIAGACGITQWKDAKKPVTYPAK